MIPGRNRKPQFKPNEAQLPSRRYSYTQEREDTDRWIRSRTGRERKRVELRILRYGRCILLVHAPNNSILGLRRKHSHF